MYTPSSGDPSGTYTPAYSPSAPTSYQVVQTSYQAPPSYQGPPSYQTPQSYPSAPSYSSTPVYYQPTSTTPTYVSSGIDSSSDGPSPGMSTVVPSDEKKARLDQKFADLIKTYELSQTTADQLQVLKDCKIIMICDDSGSMGARIAEEGTDPFATKGSTRWLELKKLAAAAIQIVTAINPEGLDVHFLNRPPVYRVTETSALAGVFASPPGGGTPLRGALQKIYAEAASIPDSRNVLIVVLTDGEPSDCSRDGFYQVLMAKRRNIHLSFAELTDQPDDMEWLDAFDNKVPNFDNTDDYREELQRVRQAQGPSFPFTYTHYVIKILLATFVRWYFNLDQTKVTGGGIGASPMYLSGGSTTSYSGGQAQNSGSSCCIIL